MTAAGSPVFSKRLTNMRDGKEKHVTGGTLVLIGGAEKKRGKKEVLRRIVRLGKVRTMTLIPCASRYPGEVSRGYAAAFGSLGVEKIHVLNPRRRSEADRPGNIRCVKESDMIFFSGGDQVRLVNIVRGTRLLGMIRRRYREGAVVVGTSAGAAAASDPMIFDGQDQGLRKGKVGYGPGFGFLDGITVDTHFMVRRRIPRLVQFLVSGKSSRGLGLSENTALFIGPDRVAQVCGTGVVTVLSRDSKTYSNYNETRKDSVISVLGLRLGFLSEGLCFDIDKWSIVDSR